MTQSASHGYSSSFFSRSFQGSTVHPGAPQNGGRDVLLGAAPLPVRPPPPVPPAEEHVVRPDQPQGPPDRTITPPPRFNPELRCTGLKQGLVR